MAVSVAAKTREGISERDEGAQVPQWKPSCVSTNLGETVLIQSEKRQEWIREIREETKRGLHRARAVLSVWPACQPHCSP